jgi:hypothetical protein
MHTAQFPESGNYDKGWKYGLGWIIYNNEKNGMIFEGYAGDVIGGSNEMQICRDKDLGFILLINRHSKNYQISCYWKIILEILDSL